MEYARNYGIYQAYLVGSLTRPYQFTSRSDVDLAVEQINPDLFFSAIAHLSEFLKRDVDIINLAQCHFSDRLRQEGISWTAVN
ncbi:nucleotidyltransferase domain-containing protein [Synechococcus sp. PCC 6312]|uniref:nucleotidyltransferase family protein n=1 Tax=Synechococcus sp. (strain ATCC 27167 / PCC 6312) TaxID=195253 RepID=UPI001C104780